MNFQKLIPIFFLTAGLNAFAGQTEPNVNMTISMTHDCVQISQEPLLLAGLPTSIAATGFLIQTSERVLQIKMDSERFKNKPLHKIIFLKQESETPASSAYSFDSHIGPKMQITERKIDEDGKSVILEVSASGSDGKVTTAQFNCKN